MTNLKNKTIADFVVDNIATADVFKKYGINYSYDGTLSLSNFCQKKNLKYQEILNELNAIKTKVPYLKNYNAWDLELLINFLVEIDHPYKLENINFIKNLGIKIQKTHGEKLVEMPKIMKTIQHISEIIETHIKIEETFLFPYILRLNAYQKEKKNPNVQKPQLINPLKNIENDHTKICKLWKQIAKLTNNYQLYESIDSNFKLLYYKLRQFEEKLHNHIHIENNILFPKALALEKSILES